LLEEVPLLLEELCLVRRRCEGDGDERERRDHEADAKPSFLHVSPFPAFPGGPFSDLETPGARKG
jgi:hypothetical protein